MRRALLALVIAVCACKPRGHAAPAPIPETIDAGAWALEPLPIERPEIHGVAGSSASDVWAVGRGMFHFDGSTWSSATPAGFDCARCALSSVSVVSKDDAWAVGKEGAVAHWDGKAWTVTHPAILSGVTFNDLTRVIAFPGGEVIANVSVGGGLIRYDSVSWSRIAFPNQYLASIEDVWGTSGRDLWLPGTSPWHFDGAWKEGPRVDSTRMIAAGGSGRNDVWMVGTDGMRFAQGVARHFDGATWTSAPMPRTKSLYAVWVVGPNEAYAVGLSNSVVAWDGTSWRALEIPDKGSGSYTSVYSPGGGVMFATCPENRYVLHKKP